MKVTIRKREAATKGEAKQIRRAGDIPAIIYSKGNEGKSSVVNGPEFHAALRAIPEGRLATTVFELVDESGKATKAVVKDIQYHVTSYNVLHLDFIELFDDIPVTVRVPVECVGVADCKGVKLGGVVRRVIRALPVRCLPKDLPSAFSIDVRALEIGDSRRLNEIEIPAAVTPRMDVREVAVTIAKR